MFESRVDVEVGLLIYPLSTTRHQSTEILHDTSNLVEVTGQVDTPCKEVPSPTCVFESRVDIEVALLMYPLLTTRH
jgi:hypothetical protein